MAIKRSADSDLYLNTVSERLNARPRDDGDIDHLQHSRSRSPATVHERRFLCPVDSCTSGANDVGGLRKHIKTFHVGAALPTSDLDALSVAWMVWARGGESALTQLSSNKDNLDTDVCSNQTTQQPIPRQVRHEQPILKRRTLREHRGLSGFDSA